MSHLTLPELTHARLTWAKLDELCLDLRERVQLLEVQLKGAPNIHAQPSAMDIDSAARALRTGKVRGVRLTYRWEGKVWIDTLLRDEGGIQIYRTTVEPRSEEGRL
jgi:hypothetical protein